MRILHYFLGFPPYRSGGMTKYSFDLMRAQAATSDHTVYALWPGQMRFFSKKVYIKRKNNISDIENYELINPLPIPLDEGIVKVDEYMMSCDDIVYEEFLTTINPNVIHIHTLMGLHREFIDIAIKLGIRIIFTTHDYFGLCPKVTLYRNGCACEDDHGCMDCFQCNTNSLSINKIRLMQSPIYRVSKNFSLIKKIRKRHREVFFLNDRIADTSFPSMEQSLMAIKYMRLRGYYIGMLKKMDVIHFNSTISEMVYKRYFTPHYSKIISITHQDIVDKRKLKSLSSEVLKITFLASIKPFKGFNVLRMALDEIWDSGNRNFELNLFESVEAPSPYMKIHERGYKYDDLQQIFLSTDVLIAPSIWYETFGFTVLEAISYGVPVIVSDRVGAKDIIGEGGLIVKAGSVSSLKEAILRLTPRLLSTMRNKIQKEIAIKTWEQFLDENMKLYLK